MGESASSERKFECKLVPVLVFCRSLKGDEFIVVGLALAQRFVGFAADGAFAYFQIVASVASDDAYIRVFPAEYHKAGFVAVVDKVQPALSLYGKIGKGYLLHE